MFISGSVFVANLCIVTNSVAMIHCKYSIHLFLVLMSADLMVADVCVFTTVFKPVPHTPTG